MVPVECQLTGVVPPEDRASPDSTAGRGGGLGECRAWNPWPELAFAGGGVKLCWEWREALGTIPLGPSTVLKVARVFGERVLLPTHTVCLPKLGARLFVPWCPRLEHSAPPRPSGQLPLVLPGACPL